MKIIGWLSGGAFVLITLFCTTTPMTSCIKETIRDTLIVKDTVTIPCECENEDQLKKGLIAYYNFNNGTLNDSSGNNNHIFFNNANKTTDRFGNANNAYLFNGTSNYMEVANSASLNPKEAITMSAFVKVNGFYAGQCKGNQIFGKTSSYSDYVKGAYALRFTHADFVCETPLDITNEVFHAGYGDRDSYPEKNSGGWADPQRVQTAKWYHVVFTYADNVSKFFVDGKLINTQPSPNWAFTANTNNLFIGKNQGNDYPYWFNGIIDDIRIYDRALCDAEVKALYNITK